MHGVVEVIVHKVVPTGKLGYPQSLDHGNSSAVRDRALEVPTEWAPGYRRRCELPVIAIAERARGHWAAIAPETTLRCPDDGVLPVLRLSAPVPVRNCDLAVDLPQEVL